MPPTGGMQGRRAKVYTMAPPGKNMKASVIDIEKTRLHECNIKGHNIFNF